MRVLGMLILVFGTVLFGAALVGVHASSFVQPSSLMIVFGPLALYLLFSLGPKEFLGWTSRVFHQQPTPKDRRFLETISSMGFLFGMIAMIIGFIHLFQNLADTSRMGAGVAVAIVGGLYGSVPALVAMMTTNRTLKGLKPRSRHYGASVLGVAFLMFGFVVFALSRTA